MIHASETASTKRRPTPKQKITVAEYLTKQIELCGKPQHEIASEAGFNKPNIITMLKQGKTKLPIAKIGPMARSLGVDPVYLFRLCMQEYEPETWAALEETIFKRPVITENEFEIIQVMRESNVPNPKIRNNQDREMIRKMADQLKPENF